MPAVSRRSQRVGCSAPSPGGSRPVSGCRRCGALAFGARGRLGARRAATHGERRFTSELTPQAGIDGLTGVFPRHARPRRLPGARVRLVLRPEDARGPGHRESSRAAFLFSLVGVLCARDALTFLFFWELMTLVPAAIILVGTSTEAARHTVFTYVAITHLGGAGTWIALLLLAHEGAIGDATALAEGSGIQAVIAVAAIIGFGTKAGLMPMHAWLPRAHPIAPASHLGADERGHGRGRGLRPDPRARRLARPASGLGRSDDARARRPVGPRRHHLRALPARSQAAPRLLDRRAPRRRRARRSAPACCCGATAPTQWAAFALGAALLHTINHAAFKALLFLGAGAFERATGALELDRLGGLLRRMPWSGGAFLVGALAIAGMPLLNGFASEWLTLQALLHVPAYAGVWDGTLGALALAALAATMALAVLCFVKVIGLVLLGPPRRSACAEAVEPAAVDAVGARRARRRLRRPRGRPGPALRASRRASRRGPPPTCRVAPRSRPSRDGEPADARDCWSSSAASRGCSGSRAEAAAPRSARPGRAARPSSRRCSGRAPASASRCGSCSKPSCGPSARSRRRRRGGVVQEVSYTGRVPHLIDVHLYRPVTDGALLGGLLGAAPAERQARHLRRST